MTRVLRFLLQLLLVSAGLVFAASLAVVFMVLLAAWTVRAGWARLTGRPVSPFIARMRPGDAFGGFMRRQRAAEPARPARASGFGRSGDVTDVEARILR